MPRLGNRVRNVVNCPDPPIRRSETRRACASHGRTSLSLSERESARSGRNTTHQWALSSHSANEHHRLIVPLSRVPWRSTRNSPDQRRHTQVWERPCRSVRTTDRDYALPLPRGSRCQRRGSAADSRPRPVPPRLGAVASVSEASPRRSTGLNARCNSPILPGAMFR